MNGVLSEWRSSARRKPAAAPNASTAASVPSRAAARDAIDRFAQIRAVLFDLDGTLYRQKPMRALMALELATLAVTRPLQAPVTWRVLSGFRKAQETLRGRQTLADGPGQAEIAALQTGASLDAVEAIVEEWMMERPLKHLARCRANGLLPLLDFLTAHGVKLGVFSDYPADRKLEALGIGGRFSVVLCSSDPEIGVFKPHPRGFLVAAQRWQVDPSEVLVVGDRPDADAAGGAAAGMPCVIVGDSRSPEVDRFVSVPSLERLRDVLDNDHSR